MSTADLVNTIKQAKALVESSLALVEQLVAANKAVDTAATKPVTPQVEVQS